VDGVLGKEEEKCRYLKGLAQGCDGERLRPWRGKLRTEG
jgi:hypothetical protein